jgi:hypothetical protein
MESLLQKVDDITEELKVKDMRFAEAEVQVIGAESQDSSKKPPALQKTYSDNHLSPNSGQLLPLGGPPSLPLCSPTRNEDEDIYMGENEGDKLKEAKRYAKEIRKVRFLRQEEGRKDSDTESESYKRTMRKRKGKAWQDEGTRDSDTESKSYKRSMQKRKGKARQVEDERMENSDTSEVDKEEIDDSDNEKEDEGTRDSDSESESYKRYMRKRKGKARQVEDERMEDSDTSEVGEEGIDDSDNEKDVLSGDFQAEAVRPLY